MKGSPFRSNACLALQLYIESGETLVEQAYSSAPVAGCTGCSRGLNEGPDFLTTLLRWPGCKICQTW